MIYVLAPDIIAQNRLVNALSDYSVILKVSLIKHSGRGSVERSQKSYIHQGLKLHPVHDLMELLTEGRSV